MACTALKRQLGWTLTVAGGQTALAPAQSPAALILRACRFASCVRRAPLLLWRLVAPLLLSCLSADRGCCLINSLWPCCLLLVAEMEERSASSNIVSVPSRAAASSTAQLWQRYMGRSDVEEDA
jgi:hypothetical protein